MILIAKHSGVKLIATTLALALTAGIQAQTRMNTEARAVAATRVDGSLADTSEKGGAS
jgi:hypothetical protein